jgi:hypothetical protein
MQITRQQERVQEVKRTSDHTSAAAQRWLAYALFALAGGLAVNSVLGPLVLDVIRYPFSESLLNETIGLEAFSLAVVAPVSVLAGALVLRGHRAGAILAFAPAAYAAYMFVQYIVGPEYAYYPRVLLFHLPLFVLSAAISVAAWAAINSSRLPVSSRRTDRGRGLLLFALAAFGISRYIPMFFDALSEQPLTGEFAEDVSMFWSIVLLDLGIVFPATIAAGLALWTGARWGRKALFAFIGWWALVPPSVAAMSIAMYLNQDPYASGGQTIMFVVVAALFVTVAVWLFRPLFGNKQGEKHDDEHRGSGS